MLLTACSSTTLSDGGKLVRLVNQVPESCEYLGDVEESVHRSIDREAFKKGVLGRIDLKNKAAEIGGDTVEVSEGESGLISGRAYRCSRKPASQ